MNETILKITDAYVAYGDNQINLGQLHDTVEELIQAYADDQVERLAFDL